MQDDGPMIMTAILRRFPDRAIITRVPDLQKATAWMKVAPFLTREFHCEAEDIQLKPVRDAENNTDLVMIEGRVVATVEMVRQ